ncbi:MAG: hypothetical protein ABL933_00985 [Methyloglobulus sp.]|nr:hypothetical protein [Methyloglobulus sp.]
MSATPYKTEQEIQQLGLEVLQKGLGVSDFIRFIQQFNKGYGNYVEDRQEWQQQYSVNQLIDEINSVKDS